jgi:hypothetical protein
MGAQYNIRHIITETHVKALIRVLKHEIDTDPKTLWMRILCHIPRQQALREEYVYYFFPDIHINFWVAF